MAKYLVLYGAGRKTGEEQRFRLAENVELGELAEQLDQVGPGQFATVPVVLEDDVETVLLRVQPHLFGGWLVLDLQEGHGRPAPKPAARGRQPDGRAAAAQLAQLGEMMRKGKPKK